MFIEGVNYLLNIDATDDMIAKVASEFESFMKYDN